MELPLPYEDAGVRYAVCDTSDVPELIGMLALTFTETDPMPVAVGLEIQPMVLLVPATLAASCAFMLPVATPPNAIVFGSGMITIPQMARAGLVMNIIGIVLLSLVA